MFHFQVAYVTRVEDYLPLPIPMAAATNAAAVAAFEERTRDAKAKGERITEDLVR